MKNTKKTAPAKSTAESIHEQLRRDTRVPKRLLLISAATLLAFMVPHIVAECRVSPESAIDSVITLIALLHGLCFAWLTIRKSALAALLSAELCRCAINGLLAVRAAREYRGALLRCRCARTIAEVHTILAKFEASDKPEPPPEK
jgi:hypothetical protein